MPFKHRPHFTLTATAMLIVLVMLLALTSPILAQDSTAPEQVRSIAWSPNADQLAVSYHDGQILITSVNGENLPISLQADSSAVVTLSWSPDGNFLASGSLYPDSTLRIWDTSTGEETATYSDFGLSIVDVAWRPDGLQLIALSAEALTEQGNSMIVNMETGQTTLKNFGPVSDIQWSPAQTRVALSNIGGINVFTASDFQHVFASSLISQEVFREGLHNQLGNITWSPDGEHIAGGMGDGRVFVWRLDDPDPIITLIGNDYEGENRFLGWIHALRFNETGEQLTAISGDGTIRTWNLSDGRLLNEQKTYPNHTAAFSPYSGQIALGLALYALESPLTDNGVQIVVPDPSLERLQAIAESCNAESALTDSLTDFAAQLDTLDIPPACQADLLAIAAVMETE